MKTADGSFHYCYNPQAVVDEANQVIVATDFAESGADNPAFGDMLDQTITNTGVIPGQTLADAGYFSEANIEAAQEAGTDPLIATGRLKHGETVPDAPRGPIPKNATPKARMARKLRTKNGKAAYSRRKVIVEPVFGQMKTAQEPASSSYAATTTPDPNGVYSLPVTTCESCSPTTGQRKWKPPEAIGGLWAGPRGSPHRECELPATRTRRPFDARQSTNWTDARPHPGNPLLTRAT